MCVCTITVYTRQHRTVLTILLLILTTIIIAHMLFSGGRSKMVGARWQHNCISQLNKIASRKPQSSVWLLQYAFWPAPLYILASASVYPWSPLTSTWPHLRWSGEGEYWKKLSLCYSIVYCYNGAQTYERFLQAGRLYQVLILLGLALYLPSASVSSILIALYRY